MKMQISKEEIFGYQEIIQCDAISIDQEACSDRLEPWKHDVRPRSFERAVTDRTRNVES